MVPTSIGLIIKVIHHCTLHAGDGVTHHYSDSSFIRRYSSYIPLTIDSFLQFVYCLVLLFQFVYYIQDSRKELTLLIQIKGSVLSVIFLYIARQLIYILLLIFIKHLW